MPINWVRILVECPLDLTFAFDTLIPLILNVIKFCIAVKTNPPFEVKLIPEEGFPRSLRVEWKRPIDRVYLHLRYHIRFCTASSKEWSEVNLIVSCFNQYCIISH